MIDLTPAPKTASPGGKPVILETPANPMPKIIGITGLIGSGKNTFAATLRGHMATAEFNVRSAAFADHLKDVVALAYGWDRELLEGATEGSREWREKDDPFWGVSPRKVLQDVGVKFRQLDPDFWVRAVEKRFDDNPDKHYILTDVRFPNEFDMIRKRGGVIVQIRRGENPAWWNEAVRLNKLEEYNNKQTYNASQRTNAEIKMAADIAKFEKSHPDIHVSEWASAGQVPSFIINNDQDVESLDTAAQGFIGHYDDE